MTIYDRSKFVSAKRTRLISLERPRQATQTEVVSALGDTRVLGSNLIHTNRTRLSREPIADSPLNLDRGSNLSHSGPHVESASAAGSADASADASALVVTRLPADSTGHCFL